MRSSFVAVALVAMIAASCMTFALADSTPNTEVLAFTGLRGSTSTCHDYSDEKTCDAAAGCVWCKSGAIPSACYTTAQASKLPPGVFVCDQPVELKIQQLEAADADTEE